ncbi:YheC/YheD family protein [Paenibacillus alkalitolerans]|uniref:YheC/YheD family protein n=1 Tax=Paenibacillus alkalitolerans TaxID=2799335 RepID=UPI0018F6651B|nr:YheC/YheD family protein [Paenibacillus alkalitolerans]
MTSKLSGSKWKKHKILRGSSELSSALPPTRTFSRDNLWEYVHRYGKVIVKPVNGYGGAGVIQVSRVEDNIYKIHYGSSQKTFVGEQRANDYLKSKMKRASYIIQRRIPLATINGRPFDLRVMVQKRTGSPWKVTGKLAKVAGKGYIITNVARSRGKVLPVETALRLSNITKRNNSVLLPQIDRIALSAANRLGNFYRFRIVGLDVGIDRDGKVWIIEPNFAPAVSLFLKLKNKSMYRTIMSYKRKNR